MQIWKLTKSFPSSFVDSAKQRRLQSASVPASTAVVRIALKTFAKRNSRVCVLVHRGWDVVPGRRRRRASFAPFGAGAADVRTRAAVATHNSHTALRHHLPSNAAAGGINSRTWRGWKWRHRRWYFSLLFPRRRASRRDGRAGWREG